MAKYPCPPGEMPFFDGRPCFDDRGLGVGARTLKRRKTPIFRDTKLSYGQGVP